MSKWITSAYKNTRTRFRRFVGIRVADGISDTERDTCECYGEQVIGMMLANGLVPGTNDLQELYYGSEGPQHARQWLAEAADVREFKDRWASTRDLVLEIVVIALIGWEIHLGYQQESQQSQNFAKQQTVLTNLETSSQSTANILSSLKETTERMNEAVGRNAKASEESATTSSKALHLSERAYLGASVTIQTLPKAGEEIRLVATVNNSGKGTAVDVESLFRIIMVPKGVPEQSAYSEAFAQGYPYTSQAILAAGQGMRQKAALPPATDNTIALVGAEEMVIYAFVKVTYKDLFGLVHHTDVCAFYEPASKGMFNCATLNRAD